MSQSFKYFFLILVLFGSLVFGPVTPAYAASLPAEINQQFTPLQIEAGGVSILRITVFNPNVYALTNLQWSNTLTAGLYVAPDVLTSGLVVNTCGGTFDPQPNDTTLSLTGGTVPAQATVPGECYVEVPISSVTPGNIINVIPVGALSAQGNEGAISNTSPASATITIVEVSPPSMSKTFNPNTIYIGDVSRMTIRINNNDRNASLTNVSFNDNLPPGLILATPALLSTSGCGAGAVITAPDGGTLLSLSGGTITPSVDCVISVNVTGDSGIYTNSIPAGPAHPDSLKTQQGVTNNTDVEADLNIQPANVTKAFSPAAIDAGDTATLTITLQNPTNASYTGVSLTDSLLPDAAGISFTGTPTTTCGSGTVSFLDTTTLQLTGGTIPPRPTPTTLGTCTITATVRAALTSSGTQTNRIPPNSLKADQPGVTNILEVTANLAVVPALTATKSFADPYAMGLDPSNTNTITIQLFNNSDIVLTGINFTDNLPTNLFVVGTPAAAQCNGAVSSTASSITLTGGSIPANSSCTVTFDVSASAAGTFDNTIPAGQITSADGPGVGSDTSTDPDLTVVNALFLPVEVEKRFSPSSTQGTTSRLTITITAPLDIPINGINFIDTLPAGMSIASPANASVSCPGGLAALTLDTASDPDRVLFNDTVQASTLAAGATCTLALDVVVPPGVYLNTIGLNEVGTAQGRTNELTAASATLSSTGLSMRKAFYPTLVQADGRSTLTITLQNDSLGPLTNVNVTDNLPGTTTDGIIVYSPLDAVTTCGAGVVSSPDSKTIQLTGGTVPARVGSVPGICTITVVVQGKDSTPASSSTYPNVIPVGNATATDSLSGNPIRALNEARASLTVRNLEMGVVKGFNPVLVYGGATSTMTIQLINPNSAQLTGIAFTDNMDLLYLPGTSGIILANPPMLNTGTCGGTLVGNPGESQFSFSGGVLQPNSSCTLTMRVVMSVNGNRTNRIPAGAVTTFNGVTNEDATEASLTNLPGVGVTKVFNPNPVAVGEVSKLTITISNTSNVPVREMGLLDEFPTLPDGLVIASPPNASHTCIDPDAPATTTVLTADPNTTTIQLTGGSLAGRGDPEGDDICTVEVDVVSSEPGAFVNLIPVGGINATGGVQNINPGTDTLRVGGLYSLGNRVWFDTNNNGVIDLNELGVDNVTVELYEADASGNPTVLRGTTVTDGGGYYRFDDLEPGDFVVVIPEDNFTNVGVGDAALTDPLAGYWSSGSTIDVAGVISDGTDPVTDDPDNDLDSDENGLTQPGGDIISSAITLGPGNSEPTDDDDMPLANPFGESPDERSNRTVDFGFYKLSLGNLIFLDSNGNGVYGGTDTPIDGAAVQLFASDGTTEIPVGPDGILDTSDDAVGGVITGVGGTYLFDGLPEGTYVVKVTPPGGSGYDSTIDSNPQSDNDDPDENIDENDNGVGTGLGQASSNPITLTPGDDGADSNNVVNDLDGSTYNPTMDFGFLLYSLGNRVWYDTDNDGVLDAGEAGIEGVRVELFRDDGTVPGSYDASDTFLSYDETDSTGYYRFDDLPGDDYIVVIPGDNFRNVGVGDTMGTDPLAGYWSTGVSISNAAGALTESAANDPDNDQDASSAPLSSDENGITTFTSASISALNPVNYVASAAVTLGGVPLEPTGETAPDGQGSVDNHANMTVDFGFYRVTIGDLVFSDFNEDGDYDSGPDAPLAGATVQLFASDGTTEIPVGPDGIFGTSDDAAGGLTTGANGLYSFSGLPAGDYVVKVTPPSGSYTSTRDDNPQNDNDDPDVNANNNDNGVGTTSGTVPSNVLTMDPTTDAGTYITRTNATGTTSDSSVDFGFISPYYSLGNRVWFDTNNNNLIDAGEEGIDGVRVQLYNSSGVEINVGPDGILGTADDAAGGMLTDNGGYYRFDQLPAGDYIVVIPNDNFTSGGNTSLVGYWSSGTTRAANGNPSDDTANDPDIDEDDSDENGTAFTPGNLIDYVSSAIVTIGPDEPTGETDLDASTPWGAIDKRSNLTVDFGFYRTNIGNLVFADNNEDGTYNAGDTPLADATMQLYSADGTNLLATTTSNGSGVYSFTGQPQGDYIVRATPPLGYASTIDTADNADTTDPDTNTDNNDNGIGEAIGAVPSSSGLLTMDPLNEVISATITKNNANGTTTDTSVDFGFVPLRFSLGNRVWYDTDNNSVMDGTEVGISGVRVELYQDTDNSGGFNAGDTFLSFETTDANGYYRFDNLLAGNYVVMIADDNFRTLASGDTVPGNPLLGYRSSGTTIAANGAITDSTANDPDTDVDDLDDNGLTTALASGGVNYVASAAVTLGPDTIEPDTDNDPLTNPETADGEEANNQSNRTVDFGFYRLDLGNLVFVDDVTRDGAYASGETLLSGARVVLYSGNNATQIRVGADGILGTTDDGTSAYVTGAGGTYSFSGLPAGDYVVRVTPPSSPTEYASTLDTANLADTTDPDTNADNNDNGIGENALQVSSGVVTLIPGQGSGGTLGADNNVVNNATATTSDPTVDFGFIVPVYNLGNRVWFDTDNNGVLDAGEQGVSGVRVELYYDTNNNQIYNPGTDLPVAASPFTTTDADGYYRFDDLLAGNYIVVLPNDNFTTGGTTDALVGYWSTGTTIADNSNRSDSTSNDPDNDVDAHAPPTPPASDENGRTTFVTSPVANRFINYVASAAVTLGATAEPTGETDLSATGQGTTYDNRANMTVDFGFYRVNIGNLVFVDEDANGMYDGTDTLLSGATVRLYASNAAGTTTTEVTVGPDGILGTADDVAGGVVTGVDGLYAFRNLPQGNYVVRVTPPSGYISTIDSNPQNDNDDPDVNVDNNDNGDGTGPGQTSSGVLTMASVEAGANIIRVNADGSTTDNTLDFGFTKVYSLGNRVWYDTDNDSILDAGESGVSGVRVELYRDTDASGTYNAGDASVGFVTTDANGYYRFDNLVAGDYVVVVPSDNFTNGGTTDALLGYWSSGTSINASGVPTDTTSSVANDPDNDLDSNADENGITNFTGNAINYVASTAVTLGAESEPVNDNDPATNPETGEAANNRSNRTVDFGFYNVAIGNLVFVDVDADGAYGAGDTLLNGATVQAYAEDGVTPVGVSDTTGADGLYSITGLPAGNYIVKVTPPSGYASTIDTNPQTDSDDPDENDDNNDNGLGVNSGEVSSNTLTMTPGGGTTPGGAAKTVTITNGTTTDETLDFGFTSLLFSLGNRVWYDTNNNGVIDAGEDGIAGVRAELYLDANNSGIFDAGDTFVDFTATDADGFYRFDDLPAGEYIVVLPGDNFRSVGVGDNVAGDPLNGYWSTGTTVNASGILSETATNDPDNNIDANSNSATSEENGLTTFASTSLSNANPLDYVSSRAVTLGPATDEPTGETDLSGTGQGNLDNRANMTVDFGFYRVGIGNLIFVDEEVAGVSDGEYISASSDQTLGGATVELLAADGATVLRTVTTLADGIYSFPGLPQGTYIVRVTPPAGYASTVDTANSNDTTDPDYNVDDNDNGPGTTTGSVTSGMLTMTPGSGTTPLGGAKSLTIADGTTTDDTVDFGFNSLVFSLGNRVWFDTDNDGVIDAGENGVNGVRVELYQDVNLDGVFDGGDTFIAFETTDVNGYYRFDDLAAGEYVVVIPNDNFTSGGTTDALLGYWSSGTSRADDGVTSESATNDPDNDSDSNVDENGVTTFTSGMVDYVSSTAVTLGPSTTEPINEIDLSGTGQGNLDNRANMTVDFGFYQVNIGDLVFVDADTNGTYGAGDSELENAVVTLLSGDGNTSLGTFTTGADGLYSFPGLPEGNYVVRVTPPNGYVSTVDLGTTANPDNNTDNDDNGPTEDAPGAVTSGTLVMNAGEFGANAAGVTTDLTVDFGFKSVYSLGNRVWFDTNNNRIQDPAEEGVSGVLVQLYRDTDLSGQYELANDTFIADDTTDLNGYYRFDNLEPGSYLVVIPADNFVNNAANNALVGYWSSGTTRNNLGVISEVAAPSPENNTDLDDNGTRQSNSDVVSTVVLLGPGMVEPTNDNDPGTNPAAGEAINAQSNRTVDFGFYQVAVSDQAFVDLDENGIYDPAVDLPLPSATVDLLTGDGLNTLATTTTDANGNYTFTGIPQGNYIIRVTPPVGYSSTRDTASPGDTNNPNTNVDDNDNGVGTASGPVLSNAVSLDPTAPAANEIVDNTTGTTTDPTLDFGFTFTMAKAFINGDAVHTVGTDVTIGEGLVYEITILAPVGSLNNITVVDTPQAGLAFLDCVEIDLPAGVTSTTIADGTCDTADGTTVGVSNPLIENNGELITFDFGTLTNTTAQPQLVTIRYSLIVLDVLANQSGGLRTNSVVWNFAGGSKTAAAPPVTIVEPDMTIDKNATPQNAPYNSVITFTIDVQHAAQSTAHAYDVVVTDQIPVGLQYVPGSAVATGTAPAPTITFDVPTNTLFVRWDEFQLGQTGRVTFDAIFVGPAPVTNSANVEWTSLEIDPAIDNVAPTPDVPVQISPYNVDGTERWYDPSAPAGVNNYAVSSSVTITLPPILRDGEGIRASLLPKTGFAPGRVTFLPDMPSDFSYVQTDLWVEIPSLGVKMDIVGVPFDPETGEWDLRWLADSAGWLDDTAYPTFNGNSAITAHTTLASGLDGPFAKLNTMKYGEQIIVHLGGQKYIYEVRTNATVSPTAVASVLRSEEKPWLTLITCKTYDEETGEYQQRIVVRAVLIQVVDE